MPDHNTLTDADYVTLDLDLDLERDGEIAHHLDALAWDHVVDQMATVRLTERGMVALAAVEL